MIRSESSLKCSRKPAKRGKIATYLEITTEETSTVQVMIFWDMGCYGFGRWVHSIPADRSKTRIKEERRFLRSVLNTITLHGGHVLIWRYSDEEKGLGEFVRGFTYSMGEFTPMTPSSFENAIRYAQANEPVLPIPGVMRGFPESYASRLLYGNVDHLFKGLGGQTTDDKDTLIKEE